MRSALGVPVWSGGPASACAEEPGDQVKQEAVNGQYKARYGQQAVDSASGLAGRAEFLQAEVHQGHSQHDFDESKHHRVPGL